MTNPAIVDWRNRWGNSWVDQIRDQDPCEACWAFASTALVECMVRINQGVWTVRSEGDLHDGMGTKCGSCGNPDAALTWVQSNGIADPQCYGWPVVTNDNQISTMRTSSYFNPWPNTCLGSTNPPYTGSNVAANYNPTSDRDGRTVKIDGFTTLGSVSDEKTWIDTVGPLVCSYDVYQDFFGYTSGVYTQSTAPSNTYAGGHVMLIVGYDDTQNAWIVKNSWGTGWGESGYAYIGYGQCKIDAYAKYGLTLTNPDPWTKRRLHSGNIFESGDGTNHRNFEMLLPGNGGALTHWWRNNDLSTFPWAKAETFGNDSVVSWPAFTGTTYNRNFETVYQTTSNRLHHWYYDQASGTWKDGGVFGPTNVAGRPAFMESNYGAPGNFEVVVVTATGNLSHWERDNSKSSMPWSNVATFGSHIAFGGSTLVQSQFGTQGNFEFVAVLGNGQMQHWWRNNDSPTKPWAPSATFGSGVSSQPCMIQGTYGMSNENTNGNFELCVAVNGMVQHWWRDNSSGSQPWTLSQTFGDGTITAVGGLLQGSFGFNLELIVETRAGKIQHYYRDGNMAWHAAEVIV